jgi:Leucine-rich repeat (LRR) protein
MCEIDQLPALTTLSMHGCEIVDSAPEHPCLRLQTLRVREGSYPLRIQPELLESLYINQASFQVLSLSPLPNLRIFRVGKNSNRLRHEFLPVLDCLSFLADCSCPSLETLVLEGNRSLDAAAVNTSALPPLPSLKVYRGPAFFVPFFASGRSLLRASLWGCRLFGDLVKVLQELHALAPNLVALTIGGSSVEKPILRAVCLFANLEDLLLMTIAKEEISVQACNLSPHSFQFELIFFFSFCITYQDVIALLNSLCLPARLCRFILNSDSQFPEGEAITEAITLLMQSNPQLRVFAVQTVLWNPGWVVCAHRHNTRHEEGVVAIQFLWLERQPESEGEDEDEDEDEDEEESCDWIDSVLDEWWHREWILLHLFQ